jgi:hypothetical protein
MFFWKIDRLKQILLERQLTAKESLFYYLFSFCTLNFFIILGQLNERSGLLQVAIESFISIFITIFGTIYLYNLNGGSQGRNLIEKLFSIGWVVSVRCYVMGIPVLFISIFLVTIVLSILFSFFGIRIDEIFVFFIQNKLLYIGIYSFQIFIIWRIGFHIKDVNTK